jgi:hypothetical protein
VATVTCGLESKYSAASATKLIMRFQKTSLKNMPIRSKLLGIFVLSISYLKPTRIVFYFVTLQYLAFLMANFLVTYVVFSIWPYLVLFNLSKSETDFYNDGLVCMEGRTIARTKGGRLALVPEHSRAGDIVAICKGSRVPLVLRDVATSNVFQIVGESYVYGIIDSQETYDENQCRRLVIV